MKGIPRFYLLLFILLAVVTGLVACGKAAGNVNTTVPTAELTEVVTTNPTVRQTLPSATAQARRSTATARPTGTRAIVLPTHTPIPTATLSFPASNGFTLGIQSVSGDFRRPVFVTGAGDGSGRLFVVEQQGRIFILANGKRLGTPFLDIRDQVTTEGNEQGLLGLAFHPDYKNNGFFYVYYSRKTDNDNVIVRYHVSGNANAADAASAMTVLDMPGLEPNHNGGMMAFGPDGYLYVGTGDGGGSGDSHGTIGNGQDLDQLLGKILRLDMNGQEPYGIPANNPLIQQPNARPEIWAYGLRNPWRFSFDRATGDLYIGDVGQDKYEEIDFQAAATHGGENYGWRIMEGTHCYNPGDNCDMTGLVKPVFDYSHDLGCAVTGGYVYRGREYPWLVGQYIFADYCTGVVWAMARDAAGKWQTRRVTTFDDTISSFGQDDAGELYVAGHKNGTIYKLTSAP